MMASHPRCSSVDLDSPDRPFDNIINFRDVGRSINRLMGKKVLKEGVLFRSARLDDASERDKRRLTDELDIATIIDLRSTTEHQMATAKLHAETDNPSTSAAKNTDHLFRLPGVHRQLISLTGKAFERSLLWRLDWWNFLKVLALTASGYRSDAVLIVGEHVMSPRGLIGLGQDTLDSSTVEMREIFDLLASRNEGGDRTYPVLVHCTQDYVRSEAELVVEVEERMKEIRKLGLSEEYTKCPDGFTTEVRRHLEERYGGVEGYLRSAGVREEKLEMIREVLIA